MILQIIAALAAIVLLARMLRKQPTDASKPLAPMVDGAWPVIGHALALHKDSMGFFERAKKKYGDIFRVNLMGEEVTFITSRQYIGEYYASGEDRLSFELMTETPTTLLTGAGANHQNNALINRAASRNYDTIIDETFKEAFDALPSEGEFEVFDWARKVICHVTFKALLGRPLPDDLADQMLAFEDNTISAIGMERLVPKFIFKTFFAPRVVAERNALLDRIVQIIDQMEDSELADYMYQWKVAGNELTGQPMSNRDLAGFLIGASFAAVTNSANGVAEALVQAVAHPDEAQKLMDSFGTEEEKAMCQAWNLECARLATNQMNVQRIVSGENVFIGSYYVPQYSVTALTGLYLSTSPAEYDDPLEFKPERFIKATQSQPLPSHPLTNWGGGQHLCPGKKFALAEMAGGLRRLLPNLKMKAEKIPAMNTGISPSAITRRVAPVKIHFTKIQA